MLSSYFKNSIYGEHIVMVVLFLSQSKCCIPKVFGI